MVFGQFEEQCGLNVKVIKDIIQDKVAKNIPVIFGADLGDVYPMMTFPIGETVRILANHELVEIVILTH